MAKATAKSSDQARPIVQFYLAEDLRLEINGKVTAVGLYTDRTVVLNLPEDLPAPTEKSPLAIKSLGFLFNISRLNEQCEISIDMEVEGEARPFLRPQNYGPLEVGRSANLLGILEPCYVSSFGEKSLIVHVGKLDYRFPFEIRREPLIAPVSEPVVVRKKLSSTKPSAKKAAK